MAEMEEMRQLPDGSIEVYDEPVAAEVPMELPMEEMDNWFENLTSKLDKDYMKEQATDLLSLIERDNSDRAAFLEGVENGLKILTESGGLDEDDENRRDAGLSALKHPVMAEAAIMFGSRAVEEAIPREGPVKVKVVGTSTADKEQSAMRLGTFLNHQLLTATDYVRDTDKLFHLLPLLGTMIRRWWFDPVRKEVKSKCILPQDLSVNPEAQSLEDACRIAWRFQLPLNEYNKLVEQDWYDPLENPQPMAEGQNTTNLGTTMEEATGVKKTRVQDMDEGNDTMIALYEVHVNYGFEGLDGMGKDNTDKVVPAYVVTIEEQSRQIVSIRRNWRKGDDARIKLEHFVDYGFQPGAGFWHLGLYSFVGAFYKGATGACRALLDSAWRQNMAGGFIDANALGQDGDGEVIEMNSGDYIPVHTVADDISKIVMPNPSSPPSPVLLELLDNFVETIRRFVDTADINLADIPANAPASGIISVMEKGDRRARAIQKRIYASQDREFQIMMRLYRENIQGSVTFTTHGEVSKVFHDDFLNVDVIPMADPNVASRNQRLQKAQMLLQYQQLFPGLIEEREVLKRAFKALDAEDMESLWKQPPQIPSANPITENSNILNAIPVETEITDDDDAHIACHLWVARNPTTVALLAQDESGQKAAALEAHISKHVAQKAMKDVVAEIRMQSGMDIPLEQLMEQLPPDASNMLAMAAANVLLANPDIGRIPELEALNEAPTDPVQEAKAEEIRIKNEALIFQEKRAQIAFENEEQREDVRNLREQDRKDKLNDQEVANKIALAEIEIEKRIELKFQERLKKAEERADASLKRMEEIEDQKKKTEAELEEIKKRGIVDRIRNKDTSK